MNYSYTQPDGGQVTKRWTAQPRNAGQKKQFGQIQAAQRPKTGGYKATNWRNAQGDRSANYKSGYYDVSTEEGATQHLSEREKLLEQLQAQKDAAQVPLAQMPGGHHDAYPTPRYRNGIPMKERQVPPGMATGAHRYKTVSGSTSISPQEAIRRRQQQQQQQQAKNFMTANAYDGSRGAQIQRYGAPLVISTKSPGQQQKYAKMRDAYDRKYKQGKYNV